MSHTHPVCTKDTHRWAGVEEIDCWAAMEDKGATVRLVCEKCGVLATGTSTAGGLPVAIKIEPRPPNEISSHIG